MPPDDVYMPSRGTDETVIIRAPGGEEIRWRTQRMVSLGADAALAETIAASDADIHDIDRLLQAGCSLELAWTIVQPIDEPAKVGTTVADSDE
jgi:hypothetical protein